MTAIETQMADRTVVIVTHRPPRGDSGHRRRTLLLDQGRLDRRGRPGPAAGHRAGLAAAP